MPSAVRIVDRIQDQADYIGPIVAGQVLGFNGSQFLGMSPYTGPPAGISEFNIATLVSSNTETTVIQYIVPGGMTFNITGFFGSGTVNALFRLYVNGSIVAAGRSTVSQQTLTMYFNYSYLALAEGLTVVLTAYHEVAGVQADFEGSITGFLSP